MQMALYAKPNVEATVAAFDDERVKVQAVWPLPPNVSGTLNLLLGYERDPELPPDTYSIGIHLENASGELVRQIDYGLSNDPFSCRWSQIALDELADGDYTVRVMVYDWRTSDRMPADGDAGDNRVRIGEITLVH
jgi:hypothetical protein